jgi:hypothetical protein
MLPEDIRILQDISGTFSPLVAQSAIVSYLLEQSVKLP